LKSIEGIGLADVTSVYAGTQSEFLQLLYGQQIHIGGMKASIDLPERARISAGLSGVDLCCCNDAGMRCLMRFRNVASMVVVDATESVVERGQRLCREQELDDRIRLVLADACQSGLPTSGADFVWGEDAWCYVVDKPRLIAEAARLVRPGGVIAFTDWVEGPAELSEADRSGGRAGGLARYFGSSLITLKKSSTLQAGSVWTCTSPPDTAQPASFSAATSLGQSQMPT
jgi:SAM-dependent methyltransferase